MDARRTGGGGSRLFFALCAVAVAAVLGFLINILSGRVPAGVPTWVYLALLVPVFCAAVVVYLLEHRRDGPKPADPELTESAVARLFKASRDYWLDTVEKLDLQANGPRLDITWRRLPPPRTGRARAGSELAGYWRTEVPSHRLVLLGGVGSGKSELLYKMMRDLLDRAAPGSPVPVLIPAASWDPSKDSFVVWVASWLSTNFSFPGADPSGRNPAFLVGNLLEEGRLAVVIDGLDELPLASARTAIRRLNAELRKRERVLISCRPEEYAAVEATEPLREAVRVRIDDQDPEDVLSRLSARAAGAPGRWDGIRAAVGRKHAITDVLRTPLMVMLADTIYNREDGPTPDELLRLAGKDEIEERLLDGFLDARYPDDESEPWSADDVRRWLGYLAWANEKRAGTTDEPRSGAADASWSDSVNLSWWDLPVEPLPDNRKRRVMWVYTPLVALVWTAASAAIMHTQVLSDLNRGLTNAVRISLAALVCYWALLYVSRTYPAALLAIVGAYIGGIISGTYEHALVTGLVAGLCWPKLTLSRVGLRDAVGIGVVASAVPVLVRLGGALLPTPPERSLVQGFAGGFADGTVNRWDSDWNGYIAVLTIVTAIVWVGMRVSPPAASVVAARLPFQRWIGKWPVLSAGVAGLCVTAIGWFADGHQDSVTEGWRLAFADGFAVGFVIWLLSYRPRTPTALGWTAAYSVATGLAAGVLNFVAFTGRTDVPHGWANAAAEAIVIGLLVWYRRLPPTSDPAPVEPRGRQIWWSQVLKLSLPAAAVGIAVGLLDARSVGAAGAMYGISAFVIMVFCRYRRSPLWQLRTPDEEVAGYRVGGVWAVRAEEAGLVVTVVTGIVAGFGYALVYGVTAALAVKSTLEIAGRTRPTTDTRASRTGIAGGTVVGVVVAAGSGFSGVKVEWALLIGATSTVAAILAFGREGKPAPDTFVSSPRWLLALDRRAFIRTTVGLAISLGLAAGTWTLAKHGPRHAVLALLGTAVTYGLSAGLTAAAAQCRFGYYTASRLWLAADRKLPWRLMDFLDDAYEKRGILRRNGAVLQFRHVQLQGQIAKTYRKQTP